MATVSCLERIPAAQHNFVPLLNGGAICNNCQLLIQPSQGKYNQAQCLCQIFLILFVTLISQIYSPGSGSYCTHQIFFCISQQFIDFPLFHSDRYILSSLATSIPFVDRTNSTPRRTRRYPFTTAMCGISSHATRYIFILPYIPISSDCMVFYVGHCLKCRLCAAEYSDSRIKYYER